MRNGTSLEYREVGAPEDDQKGQFAFNRRSRSWINVILNIH